MMNTRDDEHAATALDELKRRVRAAKRAFMPRNQASKSKRRRDTTPLASPRLITVNSTRLINGNFNVSPLLHSRCQFEARSGKSGGVEREISIPHFVKLWKKLATLEEFFLTCLEIKINRKISRFCTRGMCRGSMNRDIDNPRVFDYVITRCFERAARCEGPFIIWKCRNSIEIFVT